MSIGPRHNVSLNACECLCVCVYFVMFVPVHPFCSRSRLNVRPRQQNIDSNPFANRPKYQQNEQKSSNFKINNPFVPKNTKLKPTPGFKNETNIFHISIYKNALDNKKFTQNRGHCVITLDTSVVSPKTPKLTTNLSVGAVRRQSTATSTTGTKQIQQLFSKSTKAIVWGMQTRAVQSMLDFDFICR